MSEIIAYLEGGPLDGRTWDVAGYTLQAELTDESGKSAIYLETDRHDAGGLPIWTVEVS